LEESVKKDLDIKSLVVEYKKMLAEMDACDGSPEAARQITLALSQQHDWSPAGAAALVALARDYGTFMLRNALALAEALEIEDGSRGF
jgi:hypothetical protein